MSSYSLRLTVAHRDWDYSADWRIIDDAQGLKLLVQNQEAATPISEAQVQRILGEMRRKINSLLADGCDTSARL